MITLYAFIDQHPIIIWGICVVLFGGVALFVGGFWAVSDKENDGEY